MMNMKITKFEKNAIEYILKNINAPRKLFFQLNSIYVASRYFSGRGFFSDFLMSNNQEKLKCNTEDGKFSCQFTTSVLKYGGGAILLIKNGYLQQLEIYTYDEPFPENLEEIDFVPYVE